MDKLENAASVEEELIGGTLEEEVDHFEARRILGALERNKGSVTSAARELGVDRKRLSKLLHGRHRALAWQAKTIVVETTEP
jgi:transcriptional regulator with GAF, ATPase, and Fis domain